MDWSAQYAAGDQFTGYTGYVKHGPCSGFDGNGIMIHFDNQANALAAWTDKSGIVRNHAPGNLDFHHATVDGIEVFFRWPGWTGAPVP